MVKRLVKVRAHAADPLNKTTDDLASAAAILDPSRSQDSGDRKWTRREYTFDIKANFSYFTGRIEKC